MTPYEERREQNIQPLLDDARNGKWSDIEGAIRQAYTYSRRHTEEMLNAELASLRSALAAAEKELAQAKEKIAKRGDLLDRLLVIITQGGKWEYNPTRWTITGADGIEFDTAMDDARLEIQDEFPPPDEPRKPGWEEEWEKRKPC